MAWVLAKKYRRMGIRLISYCDDTNIFCKPHEAKALAAYIAEDFRRHGLLVNWKKTDMTGTLRQPKVLGIDILLDEMRFRVPDDKKSKIVGGIDEILAAAAADREVQVRQLAVTTGRIMATHVATGDAARLMTRECYGLVAKVPGVPPEASKRDLRVAWECQTKVTPGVVRELEFWKEVLPGHTGSEIHASGALAAVTVGSDASDTAVCGFIDCGDGTRKIYREELMRGEDVQSSTARELLGTLRTLETFEKQAVEALKAVEAGLRKVSTGLVGRRVLVYTDNQSAARIMEIGSKRPELQRIVRKIFTLALRNSFVLVPRWRRRSCDDLQQMDDGSKLDSCDYQLAPAVFAELETEWDISHGLDCFATKANALKDAFYSRFHCRGSAGVDAMAFDWAKPVGTRWTAAAGASTMCATTVARRDTRNWCWAHPPRAMVGQAVRHMQRCGARGTVLVPLDRKAIWWPLVAPGSRGTVAEDGEPRPRRVFRRRRGLLWRRGVPSPPGFRDLVAVQLDFAGCHTGVSAAPQWMARAAMARKG